MKEQKKVNVIICASGMSTRYGKNKLFEKCGDSVVIIQSIKPFLARKDVTRLIIAVNSSFSDELFKYIELYKLEEDLRIKVTHGGESRTESVKKALVSLEDDADIVLVHDGARPYVSADIISNVIDGVKECGAAIPVVTLTDSICEIDGEKLIPKDRAKFRLIQTPQGFAKDGLVKAYQAAKGKFLDDYSLYKTYLKTDKVKIVEGETDNVKITLPSDLNKVLTGVGYDIHRLEQYPNPSAQKNDFVTLCGIKVPNDRHLVAHSDGDVPAHALMDAILTAVGEPDIGHFFPVDDDKYKGADSLALLVEVLQIAASHGYVISNASLSIVAERPFLAPYILNMKERLSEVLKISVNDIGIAVTTNEKVGEIGQNLAVATFASVLLKRI